MKTNSIFLILTFIFSFWGVSNCQLKIAYKSEQTAQKEKNASQSVHYFSDKALRIDNEIDYKDEKGQKNRQTSSTIIRNDKKVLWTLIPEQKGYCEFTFEDLKKYAKKGQSLFPDDASLKGQEKAAVKTGKKKIAGFESQGYLLEKEKKKSEIWLSKDEKLSPAWTFYANLAKACDISVKEPGVALKIEIKEESYSYKNEAKEISFEKNPQEKFELPSDYKKLPTSAWQAYRENFDKELILKAMKDRLKEQAKQAAAEEGKEAIKKGLKGALGF